MRAAGRYYEDLSVGQRIDHPWTRTVTEMDNMLFSSLTMNTQPLHIDAHHAAQTEFKRPIMNSLFTLGLVCGMTVSDLTHGTTVANLGMTDVTFPKPLFQGETVHVATVVRALRESKSRPDAGLVEFEHLGMNQDDVVVCRCVRTALMKRRPQA